MATTDTEVLVADTSHTTTELEQARQLSKHYRYPFIDLSDLRLNPALVRSIPAELMFRYNFVPLETHDSTLTIAIADPSHLQLNDELASLLGRRLQIKVAVASQITNLLKHTEQSQRVLDRATEGFARKAVSEEENSDEIP